MPPRSMSAVRSASMRSAPALLRRDTSSQTAAPAAAANARIQAAPRILHLDIGKRARRPKSRGRPVGRLLKRARPGRCARRHAAPYFLRMGRPMLDSVDVGESSLASYRGVAPDELLDAVAQRRAGAARRARPAPQRDAVRRRRLGAAALGRAAAQRSGAGRRLAHHQRRRAVLPGDEGDPQRPAGRAASSSTTRTRRATWRRRARTPPASTHELRLHLRPRSAAGGAARVHGQGAARAGSGARTSTPRNANPGVWSFLRPFLAEYDASDVHDGGVRPRRPADAGGRDHPARDRSAEPEEPRRCPRRPRARCWSGSACAPTSRWSRRSRASIPGRIRWASSRPTGWRGRRCPTCSSRWSDRWRPTIPKAGTCTAPSARRSAGDKRVHVFTNLVGVGNIEVNAFQALSKVVIQKSLREGFGLVVAEALWKGTPVVAGRAGGIPLQMADGTGGILVDSVEECARAMVALLRDEPRRARAGRQRPRAGAPPLPDSAPGARRAVADAPAGGRAPAPGGRSNGSRTATRSAAWRSRPPTRPPPLDGLTLRFCSAQCREAFAAASRRNLANDRARILVGPHALE